MGASMPMAGGSEAAEQKPQDTPSTKSLKDELMGRLGRGASTGAHEAADVAAGAAGAATQGIKNLPQTAKHALGRAFGPVGAAFTRAGGSVANILHVPRAVGNGLVSLALLGLLGGGLMLTSGNGFNHAWFTDYDECVWVEAAEASSSYGSAENVIPEPYGDEYTVCVPYDTYSYGYTQGELQDYWRAQGAEVTDETPSIGGRYMVATTLKYGNVGDQVDFYLDDGTVIPVIISDIKNESDPGCNEWGHNDGHCVLEFQYHSGMGYDVGKGNPQNYVPGLNGHRVAGWTNLGKNVLSDGSVVSGAGNATNSAANKSAMDALDECGKRTTFADNSSAAAAMASYSYSKHATLGEGYAGTELWLKVFHEIFPGDPWERSCDRGVATAVRWSGTDMDFPVGATGNQLSYLNTSPKWEKVSSNGAEFEKTDQVQPGDVFVMNGHIKMWVGNDIIQQVYESTVKGTDGDLGAPTDDMVYCEASIGHGQGSADSRAPCFSNWMCSDDNRDPYQVFRCVDPDESDEFSDIAIAGVTSSNSASVAACECTVVPQEEATDPGDDIAELAVYMAATASPEERIEGVQDDPWVDIGDDRLDNLVTIMDATLGAWGGNNAYASCCQAACGVIAAAADPDIAPSAWPENGSGSGRPPGLIPDDPWEKGMGGSAGPNATEWYMSSRSDLYQKVGEDLSESELEPGDVLVSNTHVMIYVGNEAAQKRFSGTDANCYEAAFNDGVGGSGTCYYAGLTYRSDFSGFRVFRINQINDNAEHDVLNWHSMVK